MDILKGDGNDNLFEILKTIKKKERYESSQI